MIPAGRCGTLLLAAACGTATVAAAGCGGGSSSSGCRPEAGPSSTAPRSRAQGPVQRAAAKTLGAGSSRFTMETHGGSADFALTASGRFDYRRSRGLLFFDIGDTGSGHTFGGYAPASIEYRLAGNCEYFRTSQTSGNADKPWSSIDLDQLAGKIGVGVVGRDPGQSLAALRDAATYDRVGFERVRGVTTTRYRRRGAPTVVWVDGSGYVRKLRTTLTPKGSSEPLTETTEFSHFGVPVSVTIPPEDQVQDVTDEFKSQLS